MPEAPAQRKWDWRNLVVALVVPAAFFVVLELLLGWFGVSPVLYRDDPYVGFVASIPLFVEDPAGSGEMTTALNKRRLFNVQRFPATKARGTYRVFCLGGSTTHGRPYDDSTSFCGWLRELLPAIDSSRRWEVINAGGVSYASYRVALLMEELIRYEPDLFIVYSGHNEFLEERTYSGRIETPRAVRGLAAVASRTRLWAVLAAGLERWRSRAAEDEPTAAPRLAAEVHTLLDAAVGPDAYERDDEMRRRVLEHFRFNLARMAEIAHAGGAEMMLVTPASNLRHSTPFKSERAEALAPPARKRWEQLIARATAQRAAGAAALAAVEEAVALDPRHAESQYLLGTLLVEAGRFAEGAEALLRARDEDVCPLRAPSAVAPIVREVAAAHGLALVDFAAAVQERAPHGIPGAEQFFDHVHPTIETHRVLALELLAEMRRVGILESSAVWDDALVRAATSRVESRLDPAAHGRALLNLSKVLGWAGKLEDAARLAQRAVETAPELAEAHYQAGLTAQLLGRLDEAIAHYQRALRLAPGVATAHGNLAAALEARGSTLPAILHYRRAIALLGKEQSPYKQQLEETLTRLGATLDG